MSNVRLKDLGRALGMEDDSEMPEKGVELEVAEDGAPIKGDETVEAEELAVDEASDEVAEEMDAGEDLVEAEQTLESIYAALRDASETGRGISQESAQFMTIAIEGIRIRGKRLTAGAVGVPSCESFGSSNRAMSNTNLSMEGVGDVLRKVWEWIKTQIGKIVAKIKTWYKNILGLAPRLKKRAEAIKKKADGTSGSTDETTIELSVHKQLSINKKAEDPGVYVKAIDQIAKSVKSSLDTGGPMGSDEVEKLITEMNATDAKTTVALDPAVVKVMEDCKKNTVASIGFTTGSFDSGKLDADKKGSCSTILPGNKTFQFIYVDVPINSPENLKKFSGGLKVGFDGHFKKMPDIDSSADYKVLTTSQVSDICDGVIDVCDYVVDYEKKWQDREKHGNKLKTAVDKVGSRLDKDKDAASDTARALKQIAMSSYTLWSAGIRTETNVIGYSLGTSRALLTWCERSLSTYK